MYRCLSRSTLPLIRIRPMQASTTPFLYRRHCGYSFPLLPLQAGTNTTYPVHTGNRRYALPRLSYNKFSDAVLS